MTDLKKLESLAFRLVDLPSLRKLAVEGLQFEYADKPVNKQNWTDDEKEIVVESKIIAEKNNFFIYYIHTKTDSIRHWKSIAGKIIKEKLGSCLVCSHNPSDFAWVFSSLSKDYSKSFSEARHIPIKIKPSIAVSSNFVEFLDKIKASEDSTALSIGTQISDAFDIFAVEIHNELTYNVYRALKTLSEGIIEEKSNKLSLSDETLREIRSPIFTLLYRIIFLLYAEDRGILPVDNKIYHEKFSLKWIKEEWLLKSPKLAEYEVQKRLKDLFKLIEHGSDAFGFPKEEFSMRSYYGRLFDSEINSKLESWKISNSHLNKALSYVTRTRDRKGNYFFLDYAALETRHLGAVYERLLELHLHVENKKIAELPELEERKTSGSYYTPKYIVDYISRCCIEPLIDKIINENPDKQTQIDKILDLKIIDPAMGSGHFIVGVVEYIAQRLCKIKFGEITEQVYIEQKRDVVRRCIYGIDLNPLAVDLASLSLWLETLASEKPLSFLQSHLKCGNSLIGREINSIFGEQTTLFESGKSRSDFQKNIKNFFTLENLKDDTTSAVKIKLEEYKKMQSETTYKDIQFRLNCKTAASFGIELPILFDDRKIGENGLDSYSDEEQQKILSLSEQIRFFHWELEFPQVFYDEDGNKKTNSGFDCIIGNPPYVRQETIKEFKQHMQLPEQNSLSLENFEIPSKSDLSCYFYYHGLNYLKDYGILGLIASDSWMSYEYGRPLQQVMLDKCNIDMLMRTKFNVFGDADVKTITTILQKVPNPTRSHSVKIIYAKNKEELESWQGLEIINKQQNEFVIGNWNLYFTNNELQPKIQMTRMDDTGHIMRGKTTGCNDFFVISKETIKKYGIADEYRKPVISRDIPEGLLDDNNATKYLLNVNEQKEQLQTKKGKCVLKYIEKGENTKVIPKSGSNKTSCMISELSTVCNRSKWYSLNLSNPPSMFLSQIIDKRLKIYENNGMFYSLDTFAYFTPENENHTHAFLAYLSSSWFSLYMEKNGHSMGGGALKFQITDYKNSPVPDFTKLPTADIEKLNQAWKNYRDDFNVKKLDSVVLEVLAFKLEEQDNIIVELNTLIQKRLA